MRDLLSTIIICAIVFLAIMMVIIFFGGKSQSKDDVKPKEKNSDQGNQEGRHDVEVEYNGDYAVSINDEQIEITAEEEFDPWADYEPADSVEGSIAPVEGAYDKTYWEDWDRRAFSQKNVSEGIDEEGEGHQAAEGADGNRTDEQGTEERKRYGVFREDYELVPFGDDNIIDY